MGVYMKKDVLDNYLILQEFCISKGTKIISASGSRFNQYSVVWPAEIVKKFYIRGLPLGSRQFVVQS